MPITIREHARVASSLEGLTEEDLEKLKAEFEDLFAEIKIRRSAGLDSGYSKNEIEVCIEGYVKIEARRQGKGWWYRARLRSQLIMSLT